MPRHKDICGEKFGRLTALSGIGKFADGRYRWSCECDCGAITVVAGTYLRAGKIASCGCATSEATTKRNTTHGLSKLKEWKIWIGMNRRCYEPNHAAYINYGAKGTRVCEEWRSNFFPFYEHLGPIPSPKHTLDRINPFGHYEPGNCRWATQKEQQSNKRIHHEKPV